MLGDAETGRALYLRHGVDPPEHEGEDGAIGDQVRVAERRVVRLTHGEEARSSRLYLRFL